MSDEANTVHDLNGSETTKEDIPSNSLLSMRKGLFGNSASLLNTSVDSEQVPEENTSATACEKISDSNEASSTHGEALEKATENQNGDKEQVESSEVQSHLNDGEESSGDQAMVTNESVPESTHEVDHSEGAEPSENNDFIEHSKDNEFIESSKISNSTDNHKQLGESDEPVCEEMPSEKDEPAESVKMDEPEAPASVETLRIEIAEDDEEVIVQKTVSIDNSDVGESTSAAPVQEEVCLTNFSMDEENDFTKCDEDNMDKKCDDEEFNIEEQKEMVEPVSETSPKVDGPVDEPMAEDNVEETGVPNEETETNLTKDEQEMVEDPKAEVERFDTPAEEEGGSDDVQEKTEVEENATHEEETELVEQPPKRSRRSLTQATQKKTPARSAHGNSTSEENAVEESPLSRRSARGRKEVEKEKVETKKTPSRGRDKKNSEPVESEEKDEEDVTELKTPTRTTRHKKDSDEAVEEEDKLPVKKTPRRRGKKDSEQGEVEENVEEEEVQTKRTPRGRGKKDPEPKEKNKEDEESQDVADTSARRSRRVSTKETPTESTSTPARRSTRTPAQNKTPVTASKQKNTPASAARVRPKRTTKEEKAESEEDALDEHNEEAEVEEEEPITPAKGRKGRLVTKVTTVKAVVKTPIKAAKTARTPTKTLKSVKNTEDEDPYDIDDMIDNHPEPFKNIQMDVQSFGAVTFSKVGTGKYERTEKAAQERVVNLAELAPSENKPEKRKSLMDLNKKEMEVPAGSKSVPPKRSKRGELVELDTMSTPKREKKSTTLPQTLKTPSSVGRKRKEDAASTPRPKKLKIEVPELDDSAQLAADLPEDGPPGVVPGSRVFALYDKVYYPASVINRDGLGRFQVYFIEDAMVKDLPEASVIPIASLQTGKLASFNEGDNTIRGRIVTMPAHSNWAKGHFILEPEDEEVERKQFSKSWDALLLDMDDWKDYIKEKSSHATDVKMDNIESTEDRAKRRTRATPTSSPLLETKTPSRPPARSARKSIKKAEEKEEKMETDDAEDQNESGADNNDDVVRKTPQKTPKRGQPRVAPKSTPKSTKKESRSRSQNASAETVKPDDEEPKHESDEEIDAQELEPLPKNIDLFKDKVFILTSANRQPAEGQLPFRKNEMKLRILERGGVVVDDMVAVPLDAEAYLISDMHYRTHKYLAAMSRAMPCVSHEWIHECVKHEKLLDFHPYVLKGGVSILDDQVYDLPDVRDTLLKGLRVCVYSTNDPGKKTLSFCQIWDPIVSTLGATVVTVEEALSKGCDVTVTDSTCAPSVAAEITKKGGHVVSSEWLIQSIIMGARQDYDAHPRFQHDGSQ